jgi:aminopeptidase YwaD
MRLQLISFLFLVILSVADASARNKQRKLIKQLKTDIAYLASDELEGRHTGSEGERKASDYIISFYKKNDVAPYKGNYLYPFSFTNGKEITDVTQVKIGKHFLRLRGEAFPVPFSASKSCSGDALPDVFEKDNVWLVSLYADKNEADDAHFDWEKVAFERSKDAIKQGATGIVFYDAYNSKYPPEYNRRSDYEALSIPVVFMTHKAYKEYVEDAPGNVTIELNVSLKKMEMMGNNIAAYIDNHAPYTIVLGAHYDHLGYGEDGNSLSTEAKKQKLVHNGADDNASGTAALMQLANKLKHSKLRYHNYLILHFSGEELGLFGSKAFVKDQKLDSSFVAYMINMDMVGRLNDSTHALQVGGMGTSPAWAGAINKNDPRFRISFDSSGIGPSDHTSFYNAGIPVLFFFTGTHRDYHKPSDDAEKINYAGEAEVIDYIWDVLKYMDKQPKPKFTSTKSTTVGKTRFKVTLGIMPDYSFQDGGVRADGVSDGKPAIKAGIKAGDIITQLGPHKVTGMQSYMEALSKFAPGDKTEVTILRDGKELTLPIEFNK